MGFVDKLKEQASSLGSQIDQALDGTKQKSQVSSMRKQRGEMIARLGEALLEQFRQQQVDPEQLRPQVDQIFNLEWQIIEAEKAIEAQRQAAAVPPPPAQQPETMPPVPPAPTAAPAPPETSAASDTAVCPSCNGEVPGGSAFCPNCGNAV
jgi:hypothetical protein